MPTAATKIGIKNMVIFRIIFAFASVIVTAVLLSDFSATVSTASLPLAVFSTETK